jgi:hypothetical protein
MQTAVEVVSIAKLKALALSKLKPNSTLRNMILSESDELPRDEARIKAQMFVKMLYAELAN